MIFSDTMKEDSLNNYKDLISNWTHFPKWNFNYACALVYSGTWMYVEVYGVPFVTTTWMITLTIPGPKLGGLCPPRPHHFVMQHIIVGGSFDCYKWHAIEVLRIVKTFVSKYILIIIFF